jgi:hypothetical protein
MASAELLTSLSATCMVSVPEWSPTATLWQVHSGSTAARSRRISSGPGSGSNDSMRPVNPPRRASSA